ncbi:MAG: CoA-binding protein [Candidatus Methanomethylicota archaeon]|uniref:CoA-binding protein n=1 Tax=Thermoproteota archaeon TaxID=2056631 RepID=A0A497F6J9_9CREN|nr:MAG: CoA-binding protein [Candidatus Verstraetearchaeota archaeon]
MSKQLDPFFHAEGIAVIGASREPGKIGHEILRSLISSGFKGKIYPVNPKYDEVLGLKCYNSVLEIPGKVDLAVFAIPARLVPRVADECGRKGVRAIVVVSGGFREAGGEGEKLQEQLVSTAEKYGMRIIGPNCIGIYNPYTGIDTFFQSHERMIRPPPGSIAFLTQSGTYGCTVLEWLAQEGIGVSKFVSYGNMADVDEAELINYLAEDPQTSLIAFYMESVKSGRRFIEAAAKASLKKPIIVLKAGRTSAGVKAALSHTGRIAGRYEVVKAALRKARVIQVETIEELYDTMKILAMAPPPKGEGLAMITNGAGPCVMAADAAEQYGVKLASYTKETVEKLREKLPPYALIGNPVDLTGSATTRDYVNAAEALLEDPNVNILALFFVFQDTPLEDEVVDEVAALKKYGKPIVAMAAGGPYTQEQVKRLQKNGIPTYPTPERLIKAVKHFTTYYLKIKQTTKIKYK